MKRVINVLIVDDDHSARRILRKFLEFDSRVVVHGCVGNTSDAMKSFDVIVPDVVFLDINMPDEDGIAFARKLREKKWPVLIVFTTAYKNYALEAFNVKPIDFLIKPFGLDQVLNVLIKIENELDDIDNKINNNKLWGNHIPNIIKFKTKTGYSFIEPKEIVYIKVSGAITELVMNSGEKIRVFSILKDVYEEVRNFDFLQINRSVVVNMQYVDRIEQKTKKCILLVNKSAIEFPISLNVFQHLSHIKSIKLG